MEFTFKEIHSILKDGQVFAKEKILFDVFDIILSCSIQEEAKEHFTEDLLLVILSFTDSNSKYNYKIYKILTNIFSEDVLSEQLCKNNDILHGMVNISLRDIIDYNNKDADGACMLLSNITRSQSNCEQMAMLKLSECLPKVVSAFTTIGYNSNCSLDQLAMVLCNLSQLAETRKILVKTALFQTLVPFMNHENAIRRRGIIGVAHNVAFDTNVHKWMLSEDVDILPRLLLPLAGPEQFDDEDNDKLPIDLQYLPDTKIREPDSELRKQILETLNQLCATQFGRQFMRDHNTYVILRELHKWENDDSVILACENVVDILIRTEDEIGIDNLNTVEIPIHLEQKFNENQSN